MEVSLDADKRSTEDNSALEITFFEVFVAALDVGGGFRLEFLEEVEEFLGIEGFERVVCEFGGRTPRGADDDHRYFLAHGF